MATRRQVRRAIELHAAGLSARPDVVGIGAAWDTDKAKKGEDLEHAVAVYVASPEEANDAAGGDNPLPTTIEIPSRGGVHIIPVVVKQLGELKPEDHAEDHAGADSIQAAGDENAVVEGTLDETGEELFYAE